MYTIYEIPGVKVGCDANWPYRAKEQGVDPNNCNILQQETDLIQVSIDELWWQIELGYPLDTTPYFVRVMINRERCKKSVLAGSQSKAGKAGGPKGGRANVESGHWKNVSDVGRIRGLITWHSSQNQRDRILGKKWINKNGESKRVNEEDLQEMINKGWIRGRGKKKPD